MIIARVVGRIKAMSVLMLTFSLVFSAVFSLFVATSIATAFAAPSIAEIENDIRKFQHYFKQRFPDVALSEYADGVNALPQYADRKVSWELLMALPPYEIEMEIGRQDGVNPSPISRILISVSRNTRGQMNSLISRMVVY